MPLLANLPQVFSTSPDTLKSWSQCSADQSSSAAATRLQTMLLMTECRLQPVQIKSNGQREGGKEARLGFRHQRLADPATFVTATHKQMSNETDCRENKQTNKQETLQKKNKKEEKKAREVRKLHDKLMTKTTNRHAHPPRLAPTHTHTCRQPPPSRASPRIFAFTVSPFVIVLFL